MIDISIHLDRTPVKEATATRGDYGVSFLTLTLSDNSDVVLWADPGQFAALQQIAAALNTMRVMAPAERIQEPAE